MRFAVSRSEILLSRTRLYLFFFLLLVIGYLLLVNKAFAQVPNNLNSQNSNYSISKSTAPSTDSDVPNNLHNYTQNVLIQVMSAVVCQLAGVDPVNLNKGCLGVDRQTGKIGFVKNGGGAIGFMGNLIAMTFIPPAHTADYFRNLAQNFGIVKPAYAFLLQESGGGSPPSSSNGIGLQGITPLLGIWSAFRNIVYLLFVLVFIIVGIAIMLRVKIDPRTVMTVQNQIPKIIIGIILITFSFAIAGLLIDLMYVFIYLVYGVLSGVLPHAGGGDITLLSPQNLQGGNPFNAVGALGGVGSIAKHASGGIGNIITDVFSGKVGMVIAGIIGALIGSAAGGLIPIPLGSLIVGAVIGGIFAAGGSSILGFLGSLIAFVVISIAILWALFRLWFALISAYVYLLLDIILAPFWILAGLFPGSKISFNAWIRDILANLSVFPATITLFLLAKIFMDVVPSQQNAFVPPLIGNPGDVQSFQALIGLGMILIAPNIVKMMRKAFQTPQIDLSAIGAAVSAGGAVSMGTLKQTTGSIFAASQGTMPQPGERGSRAVFRRLFGRM